MSHRDQLEQQDVKSEGLARPGSVVETVEAEYEEEEGEDSVDHQHGLSEYLSQKGRTNVGIRRNVSAPLHQH